MTDFPRKVLVELKEAVANGELHRSDRLDDAPDATLARILGEDSLDRVELVMATEENYSVSLITVGELIDFLETELDDGAPVTKR